MRAKSYPCNQLAPLPPRQHTSSNVLTDTSGKVMDDSRLGFDSRRENLFSFSVALKPIVGST